MSMRRWKRWSWIEAALALLCLAGCSGTASADTLPSDAVAGRLVAQDAYYEIYDFTRHGRSLYEYVIVSADGMAVDHDFVETLPQLSREGSLVRLRIHAVSDLYCCRYYDVSRSERSIWFINPLADNGQLVAYTDRPYDAARVVVQDIFDPNVYYREFERDFKSEYQPVSKAEFTADGNLVISYWSDVRDYVTETIELD